MVVCVGVDRSTGAHGNATGEGSTKFPLVALAVIIQASEQVVIVLEKSIS